MVPTEDNYVDWTLAGFREYFRRLDYRVRTYSIGQVKERQCPVDRIIAIGNKIIGLQYKRPESSSAPWTFKTTVHQHEDLKNCKWIYYCLPDFADSRLQEVALYHCRFAAANGYSDINSIDRYHRWGSFATGILECWIGLELRDDKMVQKTIRELLDRPLDVFLVLNKRAEEIVMIRPGEEPYPLDMEPA